MKTQVHFKFNALEQNTFGNTSTHIDRVKTEIELVINAGLETGF